MRRENRTASAIWRLVLLLTSDAVSTSAPCYLWSLLHSQCCLLYVKYDQGILSSSLLVCVLLHCLFLWLPKTNPHGQDSHSPYRDQPHQDLLHKLKNVEGAARHSLTGTHAPRCGMTLELWALSNRIWLICLPARGSLTPGLTLSSSLGSL